MAFNRLKPYNDLPLLPPKAEIETKQILKQTIQSSRALAELKLAGRTLPDQSVLINSLVLLEAKDSSEIESIFTTHDKLYQADMFTEQVDPNTKEVSNYREALWKGADAMKKKLLTTNVFIEIVHTIKKNVSDIRKTPGTQVVNPLGETIYTPPQGEELLRKQLTNLEQFIHDNKDIDPLIKMAILHYQFEAIHPFTDGNGRTGRIINILYLLQEELLETPALFLSRYIIDNKTDYYKGLQNVTEHGAWESWIMYILKAVEHTAYRTSRKIADIHDLMKYFADEMKKNPATQKIYTKDLVEALFRNPYCRIKTLEDQLGIVRQTASNCLHKLVDAGLMRRVKIGTEVIFLNLLFINALTKDSFDEKS